MSHYVLSCCSTCDLPAELLEKHDIHFIPFHFAIDGEEYLDDLGASLPYDRFYERLRGGAETRTSQVNISEYADYFSAFLEQGLDVVHVCLSSGLSGTINSARNAALILKERYPDNSVIVVDSLAASSGYGLLMLTAAEKRDEGLSAGELAAWIEENRLRLNHVFFSTDLSFYVRGGRISKAAAIFGGALHICPLMDMDAAGRLCVREKVRTKKKVIRAIAERMEELAEGGRDYAGRCFLSMAGCPDDAEDLAAQLKERFPNIRGEIGIFNIGTAIGSHTGPGTVALFFFGKERS